MKSQFSSAKQIFFFGGILKTIQLVLNFLPFLLIACEPNVRQSSDNRELEADYGIIGGQDVSRSDELMRSTVGLVMMSRGSQSICTGSIVADNIVLTAAHCMVGVDGAVVTYGADIETAIVDKKYYPVLEVYIHPSYDPEADKNSNDIALVKFDGNLPGDNSKVTLLGNTSLLKNGMLATLTGYGASIEADGKFSGSSILRKVQVPLADSQFSQTEIQFSSAGGSGACHGDSGGPAYATIDGELVVIGVTSRTTDLKGGCQKDSIYTNVAPFKAWIEATASELQRSRSLER